MEILKEVPFLPAPLVGRLNFPGYSLTLIVKGTFDLQPGGVATLSDEQLYPTGDIYYSDDDMTGSCRYESDFAYYKPRTDLLLAGHCHAPGGQPVQGCPVTFGVGEKSKTLHIFGDRRWKAGFVTDPEPFTRMELKYENSYGGRGFKKNPVGKGFVKESGETGNDVLFLPNIESPDNPVTSPGSRPDPAGFGPLKNIWPQRKSRMGSYQGNWLKERWPWFPVDFDWGYYNAAPPDMQVEGYLRGDERIYCENMHPFHSRYESHLPGIRVRTFLNRQKDKNAIQTSFSEVPVNLDTLWVDMDAGKLVLVWRGCAKILTDDYEDVHHMFIMAEPLDQAPASLQQCSERFLLAMKAEEEAYEAEEPKPEEKEEKAEIGLAGVSMAVPGVAAAEMAGAVISEPVEEASMKMTGEPPPEKKTPEMTEDKPPTEKAGEEAPPEPEKIDMSKIDPAAVKAQAQSILAQAGIDLASISPDIQNIAEEKMDQMLGKLVETEPEKILEQQQTEIDAQVKDAFSKIGMDTHNLPPLSGKAKDEQERLFRELGIDATNPAFQDSGLSGLMNSLGALISRIGIDTEDLSPLIDQAKKQQERINKQFSQYGNPEHVNKNTGPENDGTGNDE